MNRIFEIAQKVATNRIFNYYIFSLILLSAIVTGMETYPYAG